MILRLAGALAACAMLAGAALAETPVPPPVGAIVDGRVAVGNAVLPVFVSQDWSHPLPGVRRAVIVVHGIERNAADYARAMMALAPADTLVVAPQFLAPEDIAAHSLPADILRWHWDAWAGGSPALGPSAISSFEALDTLLAKLADRNALPNLTNVVVAGFSAGGQVVQRYAIVGRGELAFAGAPLRLRFVVGSPSSFAYFTDERPAANGALVPFAGAAACPSFNRWRYGFAGDMPPYVAAVAALGVPGIERRYAERDIVYLVGGNDNNPDHKYLDKSCAGEAQGPTRLARMQYFFAELQQREGRALRHRMHVVDGAPHNEARVFGSPCGRAALFDEGDCP